MEESLRDNKREELYEKFENKTRNYIISLRKSSSKKGQEKDDDSRYFANFAIYEKMDRNKHPAYCRVIDNIHDLYYEPRNSDPVDDPVYNALIDLQKKANSIINYQCDEDARDFSRVSFNKTYFIEKMIQFMEDRGSVDDSDAAWAPDTKINARRYDLILENLVTDDREEKMSRMENFVSNLPSSMKERLNW